MLQLRWRAAAGQQLPFSGSAPLALLLLQQKEALRLHCKAVLSSPLLPQQQQRHPCVCFVSQDQQQDDKAHKQQQQQQQQQQQGAAQGPQQHVGHQQQRRRNPRGDQRQQKQRPRQILELQQNAHLPQQQPQSAELRQQRREDPPEARDDDAAGLLPQQQKQLCMQLEQQQRSVFREGCSPQQGSRRRQQQHTKQRQQQQPEKVQHRLRPSPQVQQRAGAQRQGEVRISSSEQQMRGVPTTTSPPVQQEVQRDIQYAQQHQHRSSTHLLPLLLPPSSFVDCGTLAYIFDDRETISVQTATATPPTEAPAGGGAGASAGTALKAAAAAPSPAAPASPTALAAPLASPTTRRAAAAQEVSPICVENSSTPSPSSSTAPCSRCFFVSFSPTAQSASCCSSLSSFSFSPLVSSSTSISSRRFRRSFHLSSFAYTSSNSSLPSGPHSIPSYSSFHCCPFPAPASFSANASSPCISHSSSSSRCCCLTCNRCCSAFSTSFPSHSRASSFASWKCNCSSSSCGSGRRRPDFRCRIVCGAAFSSFATGPLMLHELARSTARTATGGPAFSHSHRPVAAASVLTLWGRRSLSFRCSKKVEKHLKLRTHPNNMGPSDIASLVRSAAAKDISDGALWTAIKRRVVFLKPVLSPKALAHIANGFARVRKRDFELFVGLAERAAQQVEKFTAQETALFLNALARLDLRYDSLMQRFANRLVQDDVDMVYEEQHLALIVNAYARLGAWKKAPVLFVKMAERIARQASEFSPQGLANVVNAYYRAKHRNDCLMLALAPQVLHQLSQLEAQHVANLLQGFAWHLSFSRLSLREKMSQMTAAGRASAAATAAAAATNQECSSSGNALVGVCTALARLIPRMQQHFTPLEASACACALAAADIPESRPAVVALSDFVQQRRDCFKPEQLAVTLYSLNKHNLCPPGLLTDSAPAVLRRLDEFNDRSLVMLLHAFSRAPAENSNASVTAALIRRLESSSIFSSLPLQAVVTTLHALAAAGLRTPLFDALLDRLLLQQQRQRLAAPTTSDAALLRATAVAQQHDPLLADLPVGEAAGADENSRAAPAESIHAEAALTEANLNQAAATGVPAAQQLEDAELEATPAVTYVASVLMSLLRLGAQDRTDVLSSCCDLVAKARPKTLTPQQLTNIAFVLSKFYTFNGSAHPLQTPLQPQQRLLRSGGASLLPPSCRSGGFVEDVSKSSTVPVGGADALPGAPPRMSPAPTDAPRFLPPRACVAALLAHSLLQLDKLTPQLLSSLALSFMSLRELLPRDADERWTRAFYRALPLQLERSLSSRTAANLLAACASLKESPPSLLEALRVLLSKTQKLLHRMSGVCFLDTLLAATTLLQQFNGSALAAGPHSLIPTAPVSAHPAGAAVARIQQVQQELLQQFLQACEEELLHRLATTDVATLVTAAHVLAAGPPVHTSARLQQLHSPSTHFPSAPAVPFSSTFFSGDDRAASPFACASFDRQVLSRYMPFDLLSDRMLTWLAARAIPLPAPYVGAADILAYWRRQLSNYPFDTGEKKAVSAAALAHPINARNTQTAAACNGRSTALRFAQQPFRSGGSAVSDAVGTSACALTAMAPIAAAAGARRVTAAPVFLAERTSTPGETAQPVAMRNIAECVAAEQGYEFSGNSTAAQARAASEGTLETSWRRKAADSLDAAPAEYNSATDNTEVHQLSAAEFLLREVKTWRVVDSQKTSERPAADAGPVAACTPALDTQLQQGSVYERSSRARDASEGAALIPAEAIFRLLRYSAAEKRLLQNEDVQRDAGGVFGQPAHSATARAHAAAPRAAQTAAALVKAGTDSVGEATIAGGAVGSCAVGADRGLLRAPPAGFCGIVVNHLVALIRRHIILFDPVLLAAVTHAAAHAGLREPQFYAAVVSCVVQSSLPPQREQHPWQAPLLPSAPQPQPDDESRGPKQDRRQAAASTVWSASLPAAAAVDLLEGLAAAQYSLLPGQDGEALLSLLLSRNLESISRSTGLSVRLLSALRHLDALQERVVFYLLKRQLMLLSWAVSKRLQPISIFLPDSQSQRPRPRLPAPCGAAISRATDAGSSSSQRSSAGGRSTCSRHAWQAAVGCTESPAPAIVERGPAAATIDEAPELGERNAAEASLGGGAEASATSPQPNPGWPPLAVRPPGQVIPLMLPLESLVYFISTVFSWKEVSHRLAACATGSDRTRAPAFFPVRSKKEYGNSAHSGAAPVLHTQSTERGSHAKSNCLPSGSSLTESQGSSPQHNGNADTLNTLYQLAADYLSVVLLFLSAAYKQGLLLLTPPKAFETAVTATPSSRGDAASAVESVSDWALLNHCTRSADGIYAIQGPVRAAKDTGRPLTSPGHVFLVPFSAGGAAEAVQVLTSLPAPALAPLHLHAAAAVGDLLLQSCISNDPRPMLNCSSISAVCAVMRSLARLLFSQLPEVQEQQRKRSFSPCTAAATTTAEPANYRADVVPAESTFNETPGEHQYPQRNAASCVQLVLQLARAALAPTRGETAVGGGLRRQAKDIPADGEDHSRVQDERARKFNIHVGDQNAQLEAEEEKEGNSRTDEGEPAHLGKTVKLHVQDDPSGYLKPEQQIVTAKNFERNTLGGQLSSDLQKEQSKTSAAEQKPTRGESVKQISDNSASSYSELSSHNSTLALTRESRGRMAMCQGPLVTPALPLPPRSSSRVMQTVKGGTSCISELPSMQSLTVPDRFSDENSSCVSLLYHLLKTFDLPSFLAGTARSPWEVAGNRDELQPAAGAAAAAGGHSVRSLNRASASAAEPLQEESYGPTRGLRRKSYVEHWEADRSTVHGDAWTCLEKQATEDAKTKLLAVGYSCLCHVERYLREAHTLLLLSDAISVAFWCIVALSRSESITGAAGSGSAAGRYCSVTGEGSDSSSVAGSNGFDLSNDAQKNNFLLKTKDGDVSDFTTTTGKTPLLRGATHSGWETGRRAHVQKMLVLALHNIACNTAVPTEKRGNSGNWKAREEERVLLMCHGEDRNALMLIHSFLRLEAPDVYAGLPVRVQNILRVVAGSPRGLPRKESICALYWD